MATNHNYNQLAKMATVNLVKLINRQWANEDPGMVDQVLGSGWQEELGRKSLIDFILEQQSLDAQQEAIDEGVEDVVIDYTPEEIEAEAQAEDRKAALMELPSDERLYQAKSMKQIRGTMRRWMSTGLGQSGTKTTFYFKNDIVADTITVTLYASEGWGDEADEIEVTFRDQHITVSDPKLAYAFIKAAFNL